MCYDLGQVRSLRTVLVVSGFYFSGGEIASGNAAQQSVQNH